MFCMYRHNIISVGIYVIGTHSQVMGGDSRGWSVGPGLAMTLHFLSALDLKNKSVHGIENTIK